MKLSDYAIKYNKGNNTVLINTFTGAIDILQNSLYKRLEQDLDTLVQEECNEEFVEQMISRGHLVNEVDEQRRIDLIKRMLCNHTHKDCVQYIICPTLACNFKCTYCFENMELHSNTHVLNQSQLDSIFQAIKEIQLMTKKNGYINIFGGEPFLPSTKEIVLQICEFAKQQKFMIGVNTNGYYLNEFAELLKEYKDIINLLVTIDGLQSTHDKRRFLVNGKGTFEKINYGVKKILHLKIPVMIRMNLDRDNINDVNLLIQFYKQNGLFAKENFSISLAPVKDHSHCYYDKNLMKGAEILQILWESIDDFENLIQTNKLIISPNMVRFYHILSGMTKKYKVTKETYLPVFNYCDATLGSRYIFAPDNYIYPCEDLLGDPRFNIGIYYPQFDLDRNIMDQWSNFNSFSLTKCQTCNCAPLCGGGCAAQALIKNGNLSVPICPDPEQMILEEIERLFSVSDFIDKEEII